MKNNEYWQQRSIELENTAYKDAEQYKGDLEQLHRETLQQIQKDIAYWYLRFAKKNKITYAEAQQILNKNELEEFHWTVQQYIKYGQSEILSDVWRKELENASIKVHVTRLESLQLQMQHHLEKEYAQRITDISHLLKSGLEEDIYKNAYEIEKGLNIGVDLHKYNESEIDDMLKKPWCSDGKVFSERLWGRKQQLVADLVEKDLPQALIRGESNDKIIDRWAEKLDADRKAVGRVVRTERAYVNSRAALESYKKLGIKKYQILATLDLKTSSICRDMDHKGRNKDEPFFYLDEYMVGLTAPPFHCNCRTTTVPYYDDFTEDEKRSMRDEEGKTKKVPADMTYDEWYKKYVRDNPKTLAEEKKIKNKASDQKQYEKYKEILGNDIPKSFDNFQNLKYNNSTEWKLTRYNYKLKNEVKNNPQCILEGADKFSSDERKYTSYLFGGTNKEGLAKGRAFDSRLGYNSSNYKDLDKLIKENIDKYPAIFKADTPHGKKYEVNMVLKGLTDKQAKVKVGIMSDENGPRLTTVFIDKLKESEIDD